MKIVYCLFGIYSVGGIERVSSIKMNWLAQHGYEVYLVITTHRGRPSYYALDERIKHIDLGIDYEEPGQISKLEAYRRNKPRYQKHKEELSKLLVDIKADICVAAGWHEAEFLYSIKDGSKKILERHAYLHHDMIQYATHYRSIESPSWSDKLRLLARKVFYRYAAYQKVRKSRLFDRVVLLTQQDQRNYRGQDNAVVIPNPLTIEASGRASLEEKTILAVGRLSSEKNFTELVEIWAMIAKDYPDWKLQIVGDGYTKSDILALAKKYDLGMQFELHPFSNQIQAYYKSASIYAMTSTFEGFGLVLVEAESLGLPVVAYDCPCGPSDIIREGEDGFLVPMHNRSCYAERLKRLIEDSSLRKRMGAQAVVNAERFSLDTVMTQWVDLFQELTTH